MSLLSTKAIEIKSMGPNLVAAFHRAQPPLVWRFDLERNHSFTIALQGDEGDWELGITSAKGEFYPIVHFGAREDAEEAFMAVQKILMRKKRSKLWCVFKFLLLLLLVGFILLVVAAIALNRLPLSASIPASMMGSLGASTSSLAPAAALPSGIPLPADEVLRPPK